MKKITIMMTISALLLSGALLLIALNYQESINKYESLEYDLEEAAKAYYKVELKEDITGSVRVNTSDLIEKEYFKEESLIVNEDKCSGYIDISENAFNISYKVYIKCKNYESIK